MTLPIQHICWTGPCQPLIQQTPLLASPYGIKLWQQFMDPFKGCFAYRQIPGIFAHFHFKDFNGHFNGIYGGSIVLMSTILNEKEWFLLSVMSMIQYPPDKNKIITLQFIGADLETLLFIMILIHGLKKLNHQCIK